MYSELCDPITIVSFLALFALLAAVVSGAFTLAVLQGGEKEASRPPAGAFLVELFSETIPRLVDLTALDSALLSPPQTFFWRLLSLTTAHPMRVFFTFLLSLNVLAARIAVAAWSEGYGLSSLKEQNGILLYVASVWSQAVLTSVENSVGTNPEKNWKVLLALVDSTSNTANRQALFTAYIFCHYSANPAVWERMVKAIVADTSNTLTDATFTSFRGLIQLCEWKKGGAPSPGRIMPQRLFMMNPSLAALAYKYSKPQASQSFEEFVSKRFVPAMSVAAALNTVMIAAQTKALQKSNPNAVFNQAFFNVAATSNFRFPRALYINAGVTEIHSSVPHVKDEAAVRDWVSRDFQAISSNPLNTRADSVA